LQQHELRFLESLNLAGNQFRSISINGNDLMELSSIDLSNNPTLTFLELKNLPVLATLDVTGCPNVALNVENCPDVVITGAPTRIVQTPVSNISVWADQGQVFIKGAQNETASVYTIDGRLAKQQKVADGTAGIALDNNLYIVRLSNGTVRKVLVK
jgi:Leucine-rich repeat (LRR) protein